MAFQIRWFSSADASLPTEPSGPGLPVVALDRARIVVGEAVAYAAALPPEQRFDLAFCDPPYAEDPWLELLDHIPARLLVAHTETDLLLTDRWEELRRRSYGRPQIVVARHIG